MRRWTAFQGEPKPTPNPSTTEDPTNSSLRCGKWLLQSTKIRRSRGKLVFVLVPKLCVYFFKPTRTSPMSRSRKPRQNRFKSYFVIICSCFPL
ncbi:hypothetical protein RHGRI_010023 [Rhododendron griersonianum]|uniref:Uncharacterized protein n=1 Tax=Rhododendron griersonianum TaxID=479676 RepID=A0AAV6KHN9_9ERIC|nr:hypothetical protein RHGRI_010023 [Rhododendron griersonianum]